MRKKWHNHWNELLDGLLFGNHYPLGALDPSRGAKNVKYNNLIPTYTSKIHYAYKTRGSQKMQFPHVPDANGVWTFFGIPP